MSENSCSVIGKYYCPSSNICQSNCETDCRQFPISLSNNSICLESGPTTCKLVNKFYCPNSDFCEESCVHDCYQFPIPYNSTICVDTNPSGCALIDQYYCPYDDECVEDCTLCTTFTLGKLIKFENTLQNTSISRPKNKWQIQPFIGIQILRDVH